MTFPRFALAAGLIATACAAGAQTAPTKTYIVQLPDAPVATYTGNVTGLAATRPARGSKIDMNSPRVRAYMSHLDAQRASVLAATGNVPVLHRYNVTFNGFAARMTEAQAQALKSSGRVVSVTPSQRRKLDTISTPAFLGLPGGLWSQVDAAARNVKGEDVIIGVLDSGVWPENASFGDRVDGNGVPLSYAQAGGSSAYGAPPAKWKGTCQTGDGFTTAMCNNKLIGARYFVADFYAQGSVLTSLEYVSPRDGDGHGSHTASTAGGNSNANAVVDGAFVGVMSGIAPRARIAAYKICWEATVADRTGCYDADTLAAIDSAVSDGVDVINFSVSGTQTDFADPTEIAFLNATAAGVFVAASAGNSGPGNNVAHISPWLTTVGASTHNRQPVANLTLGNGAVYTGASVNQTPLANKAMVLSSSIPAAGKSVADANLCFLNSLDPAGAAGKVVVCDRGTNARVEKSAEVKRAGGVGMVLINVVDNGTVADFHTIPSVHLGPADRAPVRTYVEAGGATGSIGATYNAPNVIAPVMADFSSRGPNKANANILKPDITGPGVDIIAGFITALTQPEHDGVVAGTFTPPANAASLQGTSMSSPHMAGAGALLKQLYPTWSPAAIKSALMTTTTGVKLADGSTDTNRWGFGAGHMNPNGSANPGLVYDAGPADYGRFLCGLDLTPPPGIGTCAALGTTSASNLNLASLTAASVAGTQVLTRKVTNVSGATATFNATSTLPGWNVVVSPASLTLANGASGNFTVALTRTTAAAGSWTFGKLDWTDGVRTVSSPLSARSLSFSAPAQVTDVRASGKGTKVFNVVSAYTGKLTVSPTGLVPAARRNGAVDSTGASAPFAQCFNVAVASGAQVTRFQLFNADTQGGGAGTDLDLEVYNGPGGTGTLVGASGGAQSEEIVTLLAPTPGTYSACVIGYATPAGGAAFTLSRWVVGPAVGTQTLKASGPNQVYAGGTASIGLGWSVPSGKRYMGTVQYIDESAAVVGTTLVVVDNH